jgi:hypothetical protein
MSVVYQQKLYQTYMQLANTPLVKAGNMTPADLQNFQDGLNSVQPQTDVEGAIAGTVRYLCSRNKVAFLNYIKETRMNQLALLADGYCIATVFGIVHKVRIDWSEKQYTLSIMTNDKTSQDTNVVTATSVAATSLTAATYVPSTSYRPKYVPGASGGPRDIRPNAYRIMPDNARVPRSIPNKDNDFTTKLEARQMDRPPRQMDRPPRQMDRPHHQIVPMREDGDILPNTSGMVPADETKGIKSVRKAEASEFVKKPKIKNKDKYNKALRKMPKPFTQKEAKELAKDIPEGDLTSVPSSWSDE